MTDLEKRMARLTLSDPHHSRGTYIPNGAKVPAEYKNKSAGCPGEWQIRMPENAADPAECTVCFEVLDFTSIEKRHRIVYCSKGCGTPYHDTCIDLSRYHRPEVGKFNCPNCRTPWHGACPPPCMTKPDEEYYTPQDGSVRP
eukprot:459601_1